MANLAERLTMSHLEEGTDVDSLRAATERAVSRAPVQDADAPPDEDTWTFTFKYSDVRGKVWSGVFTNKILDIEKQSLVAVLRARLQGGMASEAFDAGVQDLNLAVAHMTFSLESKEPWAKDLMKVKDPAVVLALYEKVRSHEDRYFRRGAYSR